VIEYCERLKASLKPEAASVGAAAGGQ
jgi:hypothetical protein